MCGICGVYGLNVTKADGKLFRHLLMVNSLRGMDSTGVVRYDRESKKAHFIKTLQPSPHYITTKSCKTMTNDNLSTTLALIGHTRSATKGTVTQENAHPFLHKNVIGVHNGTVSHAFPGSDKFGTDSEAILKLIDEVGIVDTLSEINGGTAAYALVWIDLKEQTLNFVRNAKRPLHFTFIGGRTILAWSSSAEHLEFLIDQHNLYPSGWDAADKGKDAVFTLEPHDLLTVKLGSPATSATITKLEGIKPRPSSYIGYGYSGGNYGRVDDDDYEHWWQGVDGVMGREPDIGFSIGGETTTAPNEWVEGTDGIWRTRKAEMIRLHHINQEAAKKMKGGKALVPANDGDSTEALRSLTWLQPKKGKSANPFQEEAPKSAHELAFKLSQGCMCCGDVVHPDDTDELPRVKWWSRDHYVCGNCYDTSEGDWVKEMFADDVPRLVM